MRTDFDAIVVGAGPAGSSAAILLARAGWRVALIEKQRFPRRKVCGECIAASNRPLLDALGVGADVEAYGGPALREVVLMHKQASIAARLPAASSDDARYGIALGRETLDTRLMEEAVRAGVQVHQPWSVEAIDGEPGDWSCTLRAVGSSERRQCQARVAIDAHGSWEAMSSARAQRRPRRPADLIAFKANFRNAALRDGVIAVLAFDGGYGGMVVAGDGVTTVACCLRRDRLEAIRARSPHLDAGDAVGAMLSRECGGVRAALADASRDGPWLASGPIDPGIHLPGPDEPYRIGNAAAEAHPIIGEGMSMALQSAWMLCERLTDVGDGPPDATRQRAIGARFARDWRRHFARRLRIASLFAHAAMRPATSAAMMSIVQRAPGLLTLGAAWAGKSRSIVDAEGSSLGPVQLLPHALHTGD